MKMTENSILQILSNSIRKNSNKARTPRNTHLQFSLTNYDFLKISDEYLLIIFLRPQTGEVSEIRDSKCVASVSSIHFLWVRNRAIYADANAKD